MSEIECQEKTEQVEKEAEQAEQVEQVEQVEKEAEHAEQVEKEAEQVEQQPPAVMSKEETARRQRLLKAKGLSRTEIAQIMLKTGAKTMQEIKQKALENVALDEKPSDRLERELREFLDKYKFDVDMGVAYDDNGTPLKFELLAGLMARTINHTSLSSSKILREYKAVFEMYRAQPERRTTGGIVAQARLKTKYLADDVKGAFEDFAREIGVRDNQIFAVRCCLMQAAKRAANLTDKAVTAGPMLILCEPHGGKGKGWLIDQLSKQLTGHAADYANNLENGFEYSGIGLNPRFIHFDENLTGKVARNIKSMLTQPTVGGRNKGSNDLREAPAKCTFIGSTNSIEEYFKDCICQDGGMNRRFIVIDYKQPYVGLKEAEIIDKIERACADVVLNQVNEEWFSLRIKLEECAKESFTRTIQKEDALTITTQQAIVAVIIQLLQNNGSYITYNDLIKLITMSRAKVTPKHLGAATIELATGRNPYKKGRQFVIDKLEQYFPNFKPNDAITLNSINALYAADSGITSNFRRELLSTGYNPQKKEDAPKSKQIECIKQETCDNIVKELSLYTDKETCDTIHYALITRDFKGVTADTLRPFCTINDNNKLLSVFAEIMNENVETLLTFIHANTNVDFNQWVG